MNSICGINVVNYGRLAIAIVIAVGLAQNDANRVWSQSPPEQPAASDESNPIEIVFLKHARANDVARTMQQVFSDRGLNIVVDQRLNALLIQSKTGGTARERVHKLLKILDTPASQDDQQTSKKRSSETPRDVTIELLWLTDEKDFAGKELEGKLAQHFAQEGFRPLKIASHLQVTASVGSTAVATSFASNAVLQMHCKLGEAGEKISLDTEIVLHGKSDNDDAMEVATKFTAPLNRHVIAAVVQADEKDSNFIFVVRLKEQETVEP